MCSTIARNACRRRAQIEATLVDVCTVSRLVTVVDRFGSSSQAQTPVGEYKCRAVSKTTFPNNLNLGAEDVVRAQWEVLLPLDADVTDLDTITIGEATFTVLDTDAGRTGALLLTARCRKDV